MIRAGVFLLFVGVAAATTGFDTIQPMTSATFECLAKNGYQFFVARVWESVGNYDETGIANIKHANAAGWKWVDGYIFPCLHSTCAPPENQVRATVDRLKSEGAKYGMLWLDIEVFQWSSNKVSNQQFITRMGNELDALKVNWGIYTNNYNWASIVGDWDHYAHKNLWWANYNGHQDYSGFKPFGGWSKPNIHQYSGSVKGPCNVNLDQNWY
ncbi:unnamed protein product [Auanema sp. JU1783]|nr:unnamed protein product [Auanema sp. JU1783]